MKKVVAKIVKEELNRNINNKRMILKNERLYEMFSVNENDTQNPDLTKVALEKIKNGDFEQPNPTKFREALNKSKHKEMLTDYSTSELSKMKLFKVDGLNIGFALKKSEQTGNFDEIVAVFNNEPSVKGIGHELMNQAIKQGGCYLDHFDGYLSSVYSKLGFVEYDRDKFDPQYDEDGSFRSKYGEADVIYRKHKNC